MLRPPLVGVKAFYLKILWGQASESARLPFIVKRNFSKGCFAPRFERFNTRQLIEAIVEPTLLSARVKAIILLAGNLSG